MKHIAFITVSIMIVGFTWVSSVSNNDVYAISGCCKQRVSVNEPWYRAGNDLQACKELNLSVDKNSDVIFNESGKVWWDLSC